MFSVVHLNKTDDLHGHVRLIGDGTRERQSPEVPRLRIANGHEDVCDVAQPPPIFLVELCTEASVEHLMAETRYFSSVLLSRVKKAALAYSATTLLVRSSFSKMKSVTALSVIFLLSVS